MMQRCTLFTTKSSICKDFGFSLTFKENARIFALKKKLF